MKLQLPETLLNQPVETTTGLAESIPLNSTELDPILTEAVESQPEQPAPEQTPTEPVAKNPANAKAKTTEKRSTTAKSIPLIGVALAALAAVVAVASQGAYGTQSTLRAEQPHAPQPAGGSRGIVWE